ncbi:hypothetical protein KR038_001429, partial [Drosophila bunnanda]
FIIIPMGLLAIVAATLVPGVTAFRIYQGFGAPFDAYAATPLAASLGNPLGASPLGASPLAVSSSQRLDYFNQFNAAYAPARLLATGGPFSGQFQAPATAPRFIQPSRLITPGVAAPFFF